MDILAALDVVYDQATAAGLWRSLENHPPDAAGQVDAARTELAAAVAVLLAYPADEADHAEDLHHYPTQQR